MNSRSTNGWRWLTAIAVAHLLIAGVHGAAHAEAHVPLSAIQTLFVFLVVLAAPLAGLALKQAGWRWAGWLIALAMAGSFAFGIANHFVMDGVDRAAGIAPPWRPLFSSTAGLLALSEALGCGLALHLVREEGVAR
jgi:hypothetical protein